ncbi:conserved exported hypothetical protein [Carnobacterium maltaromaticum]|uniref:DUF916 and DUF3324 domain-containing protein n=1 Tax=Carnobacterium maltaromaticum TaxID=2751 RepID=UPI00191BAF1B|nr:DUF916 and DUF3324 domain-containing protein [Carnobacterium maltaromaticum]CAD5896744.1 conserved exported hypothetical protein [Carnobacterium maltaromaticum]
MRLKNSLLGVLIVSLFLTIGWTSQVEASEADYTVKAVLAENQNPKISSYFDITVAPGGKQIFSLSITNNTTKEKEYKIEPHTAVTNSNGVIDYSSGKIPKDLTLVHSFEELISDPQTVKLVAGEKRQVDFEFTVPKQEFEGILLGGFVVTPIEKKKSDQPIVNVYTHTVAAVIRESSNPIEPELKLNGVDIGQINYHNVVKAELHNVSPTIVSELKIDSTITEKGETKVLYEETKEQLKMAPNSNLAFPIPTKEKFKAGDYTVHMTASAKGKTWKFTKDFTINAEKEQKLNAETIDSGNEFNVNFIFLAIAVGILFAVVILIYVKKKQRKE